jgi:hypothetical protein
MHISCVHHFVIGPILADLIGPTFCHFCQCSCTEKRQTFFFPIFPTIGCIAQRSYWSAHGVGRLWELTGQYTEPSYSTSWPVTPLTDILRELTRTKHNPDGSVRYKARLAIKGCELTDFGETYALAGKLTTFQCLISPVGRCGWNIDHLDVVTAPLNLEVDDESSTIASTWHYPKAGKRHPHTHNCRQT